MAFERSVDEIVALYKDRQTARDPVIARMEAVRQQYNGDVVVPLPELDKDEKPAVANLLQQGIDNYGRRIASTMPILSVPPVDPRKKGAQERADIRRRATLGWWEANRLPIMLKRRARWMVGYACAPIMLRPDFAKGIARWEPRNPLAAYPCPTTDPDDLTPYDAIFATSRTAGEVQRRWPHTKPFFHDVRPDMRVTTLEYIDHEQHTMILLNNGQMDLLSGERPHVWLDTVPNRAGISWAVIPGRVTLDRALGQLDGTLGMFTMQAKLMALNVHAVQKGIFPDMYLVPHDDNTTPQFIAGPFPGHTGKVNIVTGGKPQYETVNPGFMTTQTIDRIERAQRLEGGISPEFGGESSSNIRTGRRGDAVFSAQVDFPVQEAQDLLAASMEEENRIATKIARAYFGARKQTFHVEWKGAKGPVTYTPDTDFDSDYTSVSYAMPGTDVADLTIGIGQLRGLELISAKTARAIHPWINDPKLEEDLIVTEGMERALLVSLQQAATDGTLPPADFARITQLVKEQDVDLVAAVMKAQEEAQARQATQTAEGAPDGVAPGAPEAQPGLAAAGMGQEAGVTVPESPTALGNLDQLLTDLRSASAGAA